MHSSSSLLCSEWGLARCWLKQALMVLVLRFVEFFLYITSSIISTLKQAPLSLGCFIASCTSNVTSSPIRKVHLPFTTLVMTLAVFMNGLPRIKGIEASSFISMMTKSTCMVNLPTRTGMFFTIPRGKLMEHSASCIIKHVGFLATFLILFSRDNGIRLMLYPRSRNDIPIDRFPIDIGIVKLLGSPSFFGFSKMALQSSLRVTTP